MTQPAHRQNKYAALKKQTAGKTAVFLAVLILFIPCAASGFGLGVAPMTTEIEAKAGSFYRRTVKVGNGGRKNLQVSIGTADWKMDKNGELVLMEPGAMPYSGASWLNFSPANLMLKPGETKQVIIDIQVPRKNEGPGDYRAALLIKTLLPPDLSQFNVKGVWNLYEIASLFYIIINPVKPDTRIISASVQESDQEGPNILMEFENKGSRHDRLRGEIRFMGSDRETKEVLTVTDVVVLDNHNLHRRFSIKKQLEALPPGTFSIKADLVNSRGSRITGFPDTITIKKKQEIQI